MSNDKPPMETLHKLYVEEKKSSREIAKILGVSKDTVLKWLDEYEIMKRNTSEAAYIANSKTSGSFNGLLGVDDIIEGLKTRVEPVSYDYAPREDMFIPLPLKVLEHDGTKKRDITLALSISDLHLGHEAHLPSTYCSTISNLKRVLAVLKSKFNIKAFNIILNGDIVSGTDVYRYQEFQNLVQRGHWMVFLAERVVKKTIDELEQVVPVTKLYLIRGTHESKGSQNYMLYLRKTLGDRGVYSSRALVLDIASPIGHYNVLFNHGFGKSGYYPISYEEIREVWKIIADYKSRNVRVEAVSFAHSHWLTPEVEYEGFKIHITGGFQKWEYSMSQRPCGVILFMYCDNECLVIPVRPDKKVEEEEKTDPALEYKNMKYYAELLKEHLEKYEVEHAG